MAEREVHDHPTSCPLGRGCGNRSPWKVTLHAHGAVKGIGYVGNQR